MRLSILLVAIAPLALVFFQNCGGTVLENPLNSEPVDGVRLAYSSYGGNSSPGVSSANQSSKGSSETGSPVTTLKIDEGLEIYLCVSRVTFSMYGSGYKQLFDIGLGEIELQAEGTSLGDYDLLMGLYKTVKLKVFDKMCESSVRVKNAHGEFGTDVWFNFVYEDLRAPVMEPGDRITIDVNVLVDALRDVQSEEDIIDALLGTGIAQISNNFP